MTDALILRAQTLAKDALARFGKPATITWPGAGASLVEDEGDQTERVIFYAGKRSTQVVGTQVITTVDALMSPVVRNPVGGTITQGLQTYRVLSSDDMGQTPDAIALHRLVVLA